jgi:hypothetical protein
MPTAPDQDHNAPRRGLRFLIFASPKSGTTWVQNLLCTHPHVHCAETRLFGQHADASSPAGLRLTLDSYITNLKRHFRAPAPPPGVAPERFFNELLFDLVDQVARTTTRLSGKPIYGEKQTPYLGTSRQVIDRMLAYDPAIRMIHLVRDGRDVVVSGAAHWGNLSRAAAPGRAPRPAPEPRLPTGGVHPESFEMFIRYWTEANRAVIDAAPKFRHFLQVRYEDLLEHPEREATRLLEFIGAGNDAATVKACVHAASFEALSGGRARGDEDASSFYRKGIAGDWRDKLSPEQTAEFERLAGDLLDRFGYQRSGATTIATAPEQRLHVQVRTPVRSSV